MRRPPYTALAAVLLLALAAAAPAAAQADLGLRTWGVRAGAASDPDQALLGVHADLGDLLPDLRLQPSLELGFGDADSVQLLVPVHYRFATGGDFIPYAGGGVLLAWIDYDEGDDDFFAPDDDGFDVAPVAVGGIVFGLTSGNDLLVELQLGGGEAFDAKVVVGLTF